jgi:hypothetical protein
MVHKGRGGIVKASMNEAYLDGEQCPEAGLSDFDLQEIKNIFIKQIKMIHRNDYLEYIPVDWNCIGR